MIPEKITFRLGHLAGPLGQWCDKHQIKPSEAAGCESVRDLSPVINGHDMRSYHLADGWMLWKKN
jgi:hypothetical protein